MGQLSEESLAALEKRLGVTFHDRSLLEQALTHRSYRPEGCDPPIPSNERLEFLGGAGPDAALAVHLYTAHEDWSPGKLSRARAAAVSANTLSQVGRELGLGRFLLLGRGEEGSGGRDRPSILAGAVEAVMGAVFLETVAVNRYRYAAHKTVRRIVAPLLRTIVRHRPDAGYDVLLHEVEQQVDSALPPLRPAKAHTGQRDWVSRAEACLDVGFRSRELLKQALTHASARPPGADHAVRSNGRLAFVGHAFLNSTVATHLYAMCPDRPAAELAGLRMLAIREAALAHIGRRLGLGELLLLGESEEQSVGRDHPSLLADAVKAVWAALALDAQEVDPERLAFRSFLVRLLGPSLEAIERNPYRVDHKRVLQELSQKACGCPPTYRVVRESGPDDDRTCVVEACLGAHMVGVGEGASREEAEQEAAEHALEDEARRALERMATRAPGQRDARAVAGASAPQPGGPQPGSCAMGHVSEEDLAALEERLGVTFHDRSLLEQALTHRSYRPEGCDPPIPSNERLEFLGDAMINGIVATHLCQAHPDWTAAQVTGVKATAVSEATLRQVGRELGLGESLVLGEGEEQSGGRERPSILAGALEAVAGAVFLDNREYTQPRHATIATCQFVCRIAERVLSGVGDGSQGDAGQIAGAGHEGNLPRRDLDALEARLGLRFRDRSYLEQALTHGSHRPIEGSPAPPSNERLKLVGKAMLDVHLAVLVTLAHPDWGPEELTKARAAVLSRHAQSHIGRDLGLGEHLLLGESEEQSGARARPSMLADALEAVVGAVFCDGIESRMTYFATPRFVLRVLGPSLEAIERDPHRIDHKSLLQELSQKACGLLPSYRVAGESGPDHEKTYLVEACLGDHVVGVGEGSSRKEAEQEAAGRALEHGAHAVWEGIGDQAPN